MTKIKLLKIKIGSCFVGSQGVDVFTEAWEKTSKDGKTKYYEIRNPVFVQEVEKKESDKEPISA